MSTLYRFLLILAAASAILCAQEFRGTIGGLVTDGSGAPVAGAKVIATGVETGTKAEAFSDATGHYSLPFLLPGDYDLTVQLQGFKEFVRKGIHLGAGDHPDINAALQVGDATQTVEVKADAPLVNSENASVGQAITTKEVEDLPLNGGSAMQLAQLAIGVIPSPFNSSSTVVQPYESTNSFSIGGTPTQTSEVLLDGAPNASWDNRSAFTPPRSAVQEVRVKAFDSDVAFGHTGGGTINMILKSGGNSVHGSMYENNQPSNMTANNFFNNRNNLGNPVTHYNLFGVSAGGPVWVPKVYDGRNKLFWFVAWEGSINSQPNNNTLSVPTAEEKKGDFGIILQTDKTQLYDPYSATQTGSVINRVAYPNNVIPPSQFNPIAVKYLQFYPAPNVTSGATFKQDGYNNYGNNATSTNRYYSQLGRLDYNLNEKNRLFFDVRHNTLFATKNNYYQNIASGTITNRENWGASLDEVYIANPANIFNVRLNFTALVENSSDPSAGVDPTTYGFPAYMASNSQRLALPYMYFSTSTLVGSLGTNSAANRPSQSNAIFASWTHVIGNHTLKLGTDVRQYRLSTITYAASAGSFNFGGNSWVRQSSSSSSTVAQGQDLASFLLGLPYQGFYDVNTFGSWYSYYASGFLQDDWRVRSNITVNIGIRFDHDGPYHEKYGRTVNGFDATTPNPLATAAVAAYTKSPAPLIPTGTFNVLGGLTYPKAGDTAVYQNTSHLVSPRVGIAWTPERMRGKSVLRAGFGMFVSPITIAYLAQNGNYSSNPLIDQEGFSQQTSMTVTSNNYLKPGPATLSDPFPTGILKPAGNSGGALTFVGQNISFLNPQMKSPYSLRWNFGFQHTLSPNTLLEVLYLGNHAVHTAVNLTQLNGIPRQYLSTATTRDAGLIATLNGSIANPFNGLIASGTPSGATTSVAQLLAKYPQYPLGYTNGGFSGSGGVLEQNLNVGSSYFHSLNVRLMKRLSGGITITGNYIFSRLMEQNTWLNDTDYRPEKRVSPFDHTQRGVLAVSYTLPVGKGKRFDLHNGIANMVLGGWLVNGIYTRQGGAPMAWIGSSSTTIGDYVYNGQPLNYSPRKVDGTAFNTAAFDTTTAGQFAYHVRTFGTTFSSVRGDGTNELNASLLKRVPLGERKNFQLRFETFNLMNHPTFSFPNVAATTSGFGLITAQSNRSRSIQIGAQMNF